MNAAVYYDPYKLPAGMLALGVHAVFFALLYFGFSWQTLPPVAMSVELWQSLPEPTIAPPIEAKLEEVAPPPEPVEVVKPDIVIPDKKLKPKPEVVPPKPEVKPEPKKLPEVRKAVILPALAQPSAAEQQATRDKAAQDAAVGKMVGEYTDKIAAKIRRNIVEPPGVANDARAEFLVTVLPGGRVLPPRLVKSSGNAAYDNAVERAILKSEPLPMPEDAGLFNRFRELKLGFKPVE